MYNFLALLDLTEANYPYRSKMYYDFRKMYRHRFYAKVGEIVWTSLAGTLLILAINIFK